MQVTLDLSHGAPMQSTLKPKQADDPHDVLEVAPGVVLVAPGDAEEELSNLLRAAARQHSDPQVREEPDFSAGPPMPPVDTKFRATAVNKAPGDRPSMGGRALRAVIGFLLAIGIGIAAAAWQAYGDAAQQMIANLVPQLVPFSSAPLQNTGLPEQPSPAVVQASGAKAAAGQPAETAAQGVAPASAAPSPAEAPSLQSMARDLAAAGQEIEQLKASIEQLKASQEQMSRDIAKASETKASEPNLRPKLSALPPRPAAVPARKPVPSWRPSQAAAPYVPPPAAAPYVPRQPEPLPPQAAAPPPPVDPELASVPRPPLPVRE
jgi:hypothetical protein